MHDSRVRAAPVHVVKDRLVALIALLRADGLAVSVAESIDAAAAAAAIGFARADLRDALAAALVKDERDRERFDRCFDEIFPAAPPVVPGRRRGRTTRAPTEEGAGTGPGGREGVGGSGPPAAALGSVARGTPAAERDRPPSPESRQARGPVPGPGRGASPALAGHAAGAASRSRREAEILAKPFRAMTPQDVDEAQALVRTLARRVQARLRRRLQPRVRERLDFRRTIRAAIARGGVLVERRFRGRRPGRPVLVALCDLSASAAVATDFFLALLAPSTRFFRSVRLFGYVDRLVEIELVDGQIRPAGPIDLMARSDFGRVLADLRALADAEPVLGADTVFLVLGDARNNRRPPRADLLAAARTRVRRLLWLNPEPRERWNTGDSVMAVYARTADLVVPCGSLATLDEALGAVARL